MLFLYSAVDEFVMSALGSYEKRKLVSIETQEVNAEDTARFEEFHNFRFLPFVVYF